ncbi:hypothetical protein TNCV_2785091 [Trichonephila clavipes]|nr:hypothetical protein TNCV_2785091 [Trichonephila clavipes]
MAFLGKARKQDLVLLAEELGQIKDQSIRSMLSGLSEDLKNTSLNYRISIGRAGEHMRETSPAVLMAEITSYYIKEKNGMDDLRVVYVKVKGICHCPCSVQPPGHRLVPVRGSNGTEPYKEH